MTVAPVPDRAPSASRERPPYTPSQWQAIVECDRHLLVSAGAGTGKTHTVVGRLLWLLGIPLRDPDGAERAFDAPLRMRDLAAITFTNQSAADLKRKLRERLREHGRRDLAYEVDSARVGTIHAFCGDVLREFALRGGAPAAGRVLEEGESAALTADCAREVLLGALEERQVAGLEDLLRDHPVAAVEGWICGLVSDADRLRRLTDAHDEHDPRERALLRLAHDTLALLHERLDERGAMDFDRMVVATRDLIRDDAGVRGALRRRIRVLVVDEFQDVDPVQREIAYLLGGVDDGAPEAVPDAARLMLVGDPKQSIYRFRRADVSVWNQVRQDFERSGHGRVVSLAENFRSVAPVLAFVEECIGPALDAPAGGEGAERQPFEVSFSRVDSTRTDPPPHAGVEFLVVPPHDDGRSRRLEDARAMEAASVAHRMALLNRDHGVPWREMAILLGGWGALDVYRDALRARGIPTYALRSGGFLKTREVVDLQLALQVARDPGDDRALMGFLRSPFVGVRDDTLLAIARQCRRPYWHALDDLDIASADERELLAHGRRLVSRLAALRDRVPVARLLEETVHETGYLAHLALLGEDGAQAAANVRQFISGLRERPDVTVGELLREIADARARGDDAQQARLYGEREDVVTITSVHSSKGLEWGVVFWCDLMRAPKSSSSRLLTGRDRLCLGDPDAATEEQSPSWRELHARLELEGAAEQRRLWYVAATRAKDLLVLSGIAPGKGARLARTPAGMLVERYPLLGEGVEGGVAISGQGVAFDAPVSVAASLEPAAGEPALAGGVAHPDTLVLPAAPVMAPAGSGRHSATSLMTFQRCERRHWLRYVAGVPEPRPPRAAPPSPAGAEHGVPVVHGQIVHDVLERLRDEAELELLLEEAILERDSQAPAAATEAGTRYRERLLEEIARVAAEPSYAAIAAHPTARRELGFLHLVSETARVSGSMDLVARDDDGVVILDVKTSRVDGPEAAARVAARYDVQRDVYSAAAARISGLPVSRFVFHFTHGGVSVEAGEGDEPALDHVGVGEPALATDARECAGCGYRAAGWCEGVAGDVEDACSAASVESVGRESG